MNTLRLQGAVIPRAEMECRDPDDESTQEVEIDPLPGPAGDGEYDDDRR
jgi:hypothetical protein